MSIRTSKVFMLPNPRKIDFKNPDEVADFIDLLVKALQELQENVYKDLKWLDENKQDK